MYGKGDDGNLMMKKNTTAMTEIINAKDVLILFLSKFVHF